jgi:hypothetical protein
MFDYLLMFFQGDNWCRDVILRVVVSKLIDRLVSLWGKRFGCSRSAKKRFRKRRR